MKKIGIWIAIVFVMASLASCAASPMMNSGGGGTASAPAAAPADGGAPADTSYSPAVPNNDSFTQSDSFADSTVTSESATSSAPMAPAPEAGAGSKSDVAQAAGPGRTETQIAANSGRKISFSATFTINTKQYDKDYAAIGRIVTQAGGYIASENSSAASYGNGVDTGRSAYLSLRVPVDKFDSVLDGMNGVGTVVNKSRSSQDLTSQYFDTESRISLLEMRRDRIMGYLKDATDPDQIVAFERELTNTLYELDTYQSDKRQMDQLVDFSTIDVTLYELITPETIGADGQPLGERASSAFALSSAGVGSFLRNLAIFGAAAVPVIALLAVIAVIVLVIIRLVRWLRAKRPWTRKGKGNPEA